MEKINPDGEYSLVDAHRLIPQIKSRITLANYIQRGELKAIIKGEISGKKYLIKGQWILDFLKTYDPEETRKKMRMDRIKQSVKSKDKNL
jgi:hypothetical protein